MSDEFSASDMRRFDEQLALGELDEDMVLGGADLAGPSNLNNVPLSSIY